MLWEPAGPECGEKAWAMAGRGITARLEAGGPPRLALIREQAAAVLDRMEEWREAAVLQAPPARVFGGAAFFAGAGAGDTWSAFGEASFFLPRWLYGERDGAAFIRLCIPVSELVNAAALHREIAAVRAALHRAGGAVSFPSSTHTGKDAAAIDEETSREIWTSQVNSALDAIRGRLFSKVVLARRSRLRMPQALDLALVRERLATQEPCCLRFAVQREGATFLGATPERLVELHQNRVVCHALGGSLPRNGDDVAEAAVLLGSAKDRREHQMVVDGIRDSLTPFCSFEYSNVPTVRTLGSIHHLYRLIEGRLHRPAHVLDLVAALHPTPAVCGFPRAAAERWIADHETGPRGWYAGPIGWFDRTGEGCFAVGIRSALVSGNDAWLFAGCGIVEGSDPVLEYAETTAKQLPMLRALGVLD